MEPPFVLETIELLAPYNITITNPVGKVNFPGELAILDRDVKETLYKMSASSTSSRPAPTRCRLWWLGIAMITFVVYL
jgi:hypothetical protein